MGNAPTSSAKGTGAGDQLAMDELRSLLVGPEQRQIAEVQATMQDPVRQAQAVGSVLPEAVQLASQRDQRFGRALAPSVETALRESIQRDPVPLADAIFPIIGPAIRRSIAAMFRELSQSLNRTLEHSLSVKGLRWRLEAMRTGKTFAEVVMAHTLVYRVEQVLLLHNETSLLLAEAYAARTESRDADQISAMLAAIQDFMRDSFRTERQAGLNTVEFGELNLWLEHGPRATLVAAIRGDAPESFRPILKQVIEDVHASESPALVAFSGDNAPFSRVIPELERCLVAQHQDQSDGPSDSPKSQRKLWIALGVAGLLVALWLGTGWWRGRAWRHFQAELARTEGILLTEVSRSGGVWTYRGMRDPLATAPLEVLARHELPTNQVRFELVPFWSLAPDLVLKRATQRLAPPAGVTLRLQGETLIAAGSAPVSWMDSIRSTALTLPGISAVDTRQLQEASHTVLTEAQQKLENQVIYFSEGTTPLASPAELDRLAGDIRELIAAAAAVNRRIVIELLGHTDRKGAPEANHRLAMQRAQWVSGVLMERDIGEKALRAISRGTNDASSDLANPQDRRVTMRVEVQGP